MKMKIFLLMNISCQNPSLSVEESPLNIVGQRSYHLKLNKIIELINIILFNANFNF